MDKALKKSLDKKWRELFGGMGYEVMRNSPEMGGFLIDHKNKTVILDENALKLAEIDTAPDYDTMIGYLDILSRESKKFAMLAPIACYSGDDYTAGILRWHYDFSGAQAKDKVPIVERSKIELAIKKNPGKGVLALVEFVMSDRSITLRDAQIFGVLAAVNESVSSEILIAANYPMCYWIYIPECDTTPMEILERIKKAVEESGHGAVLGGKETRYITFNAGLGLSDGKVNERIASAEFALYEANIEGSANGHGVIKSYSDVQFEQNKDEFEKMNRFFKLIRENLFVYHFQPIVSAKDGEILAYELLMRSTEEIGMFPLEILQCAERAGRLYDIEKATISNALDIIAENQDKFRNKKLFVNAITAHMLTDADWKILVDRYGELMEKMVIEFTEQTELSDAEAEKFKTRLAKSNIKIAIDDYGTGYSNTSNLIKYSPNVVKIDRSLITGIHTKPSLRKLVAGTIQFIHENGFQALAEGIETFEELKTMIQLGSDLIQGYYTARPKPIILENVSSEIQKAIISVDASSSAVVFYHPKDGETVSLDAVKAGGYKALFIEKELENVTIVGDPNTVYVMTVKIEQSSKAVINIENVHLKSEEEAQIIEVRDGADISIRCCGSNSFDGHGIFVPRKASLKIWGDGGNEECKLSIISNSQDCYGIGCPEDNSHGNVTINMGANGILDVTANGDKSVGIGGGNNDESKAIQILGGTVNLHLSGGSCVAVGTRSGNSIVDIYDAIINVTVNAPDSVAIGSLTGKNDIEMKNFTLELGLFGINIAGVGSIESGSGKIIMRNGIINSTIKGRSVNFIGTREGKLNLNLKKNFIKFYSESGSVSGIGDMYGDGDVLLDQNHLDFDMRTGEGLAYGSRGGKVEILNRDPADSIKINA